MKRIFVVLAICLSASFVSAQSRMSAEMLWQLGRVSLSDVSPDGKTALAYVTNYDVGANQGNTKLFKINIKTGEVGSVQNNISDAKFMMDGTKIGGELDGQFVLADLNGGNITKLTNIENASNWKAVELADGKIYASNVMIRLSASFLRYCPY